MTEVMRSYSQKLWSAAHSCRAPPRGIRWPTRAPGRRNHSLAHGLQEGLNRPGSRAPAPDKSRSWGASETWRSAQASPASACSLFPPHTPATPHVSVCGKGSDPPGWGHSKDARAWEVGARGFPVYHSRALELPQVQGWSVGKSLKQTWYPEVHRETKCLPCRTDLPLSAK